MASQVTLTNHVCKMTLHDVTLQCDTRGRCLRLALAYEETSRMTRIERKRRWNRTRVVVITLCLFALRVCLDRDVGRRVSKSDLLMAIRASYVYLVTQYVHSDSTRPVNFNCCCLNDETRCALA